MKKILFVFIFGIISALTFAAPFGLKMGMTIEEIEKACEEEPSFLEDGIYLIKPIKSHPLFKYYAAYVNEKTGLYQIRAMSATIATNKYGTELQNAFTNVKDRIAKTYGKPKINNKIDSSLSSYYQKDENWFYTLKEGSRELSAVWAKTTALADNLNIVALECIADSGLYEGSGHLVLYYYFNNADIVEDEQDSVF
ncbi:MAG: hypothetical protein J6I73_08360 [Treponema sp.]|nr:hypothetical protein [Treponema sp.]